MNEDDDIDVFGMEIWVMLVDPPKDDCEDLREFGIGFGFVVKMVLESDLPPGSKWIRKTKHVREMYRGRHVDVYQSPAAVEYISKHKIGLQDDEF
jgi:hypothetical protein